MSPSDTPFARAVVADGTLTLNRWAPSLFSRGPVTPMLDAVTERGVALLDLTRLDDDELVVSCVPAAASLSPEQTAVIVRWATAVGWRRVWLPDAVVELADELAEVTVASVICPTCTHTTRDSGASFWAYVREHGCFPQSCPLCSGSLPEWTVAADTTLARVGEPEDADAAEAGTAGVRAGAADAPPARARTAAPEDAAPARARTGALAAHLFTAE